MKRLAGTLLLLLFCPLTFWAQTVITRYQYWFDNDYAAAIQADITPADEFTLNASVSTEGLSPGLHVFNIRFADDSSRYSVVKSQYFVKAAAMLTAYEYWFDEDHAGRVSETIAPANTFQLNRAIDVASLPPGIHQLNVRFKDANGSWSVVKTSYFYNTGGEIAGYEYWFDDNYNGRVSYSGSAVSSFQLTDAIEAALSPGYHTFNIRFRTTQHVWSVVKTARFVKTGASGSGPLIVAYRYWMDNNEATLVTEPVPVPAQLVRIDESILFSSLSAGPHTFNFQAKDVSGLWSPVIQKPFTHCSEGALPVFPAIPPICHGATPPVLPAVSLNGISGTWSPATVSNTTTGLYTFTPSDGSCSTTLTVTVNPSVEPAFAAIGPICAGASAPVLPATSLNGITGTWSPATVNNTATTTYTFTPAQGQCATSTTLTVNVSPVAAPTISASGPTSFCAGGSVVLTSSTPAGNQWWSSNASGTVLTPLSGATNQTYTATTTGYYVVSSSAAGCSSGISNIVHVTVASSSPAPTISISSNFTSMCGSRLVTFTSSTQHGGGAPAYQWRKNGVDIPDATDASYSSNTLIDGDVIDCILTSSLSCVSTSSATSNAITLNVSTPILPTITASGPTSICTGEGSVVLTSSLSTGNQWYKQNLNGTNSTLLTGETNQTYTATTTGRYYVAGPSNGICAPHGSNYISVVIENLSVAPTITASGPTSFCTGGSVVLTSSAPIGNQWWSSNASGTELTPLTGATNQTYTVTTTGYYVAHGSAGSCNTGISNIIHVTVANSSLAPTISISSNITSMCGSHPVTFTSSTQYGGATPAYQWRKNGVDIPGATNASYSSNTLVNGDVIHCILTSSLSCVSTNSATSNAITLNVSTPILPTITASGATTICTGGSVVLTSSLSTGNQWYKQDLNGTNSTLLTGETNQTYTATTTGRYYVAGPPNGICAPHGSNYINVIIGNLSVAPTITASGPTSICTGESVVLTSSISDGNQWWWMNANTLVLTELSGETNETYTATATGYYYVVNASDSCGSRQSNLIHVLVEFWPPNPIITASNAAIICEGSVTLISNASNGNQWWKSSDGFSFWPIYDEIDQTYIATTSGYYGATSTSPNAGCSSGPSNIIYISDQPPIPTISISSNITSMCGSHPVTFTSGTQYGGATPAYQWRKNGVNIPGATNASYSSNGFIDGDVVDCILTSSLSCVSTSSATSNAITINVSTPVIPTITASGPTTICTGGSVVLTSSLSTGNQWYKENLDGSNFSILTGETNQTYTATTAGIYYVAGPSNDFCAPHQSNVVSVTVNPAVTPAFTAISPFCAGSAAPALPATSVNGIMGSWSPAVVGNTATATYTFTPDEGQCATTTELTVTVNQPLTPLFAVIPPLLAGSAVPVLQAVSLNGISGTWSPAVVSNTESGTYTFTPDSGECATSTTLTVTVINCKLTLSGHISDAGCFGSSDGSLTVTTFDSTGNCEGAWSVTLTGNATSISRVVPSSADAAVFTDLPAGSYTVYGNNSCGCSDNVDLQINQHPPTPVPVIVVQGPDSVCAGSSIVLNALPLPSGNFTWSNGQTGTSLTMNVSGTFSITYTDSSGCTSVSEPVAIYVDTYTPISANGSGSICRGETVQLNAQPGATYLWSTGETTRHIIVSPLATTTYYLDTKSGTGCSYRDSITVTVNPAESPGAVVNMQPADGATDLPGPLLLSWQPGQYNTHYDLYLWRDGTAQPQLPVRSNITGVHITTDTLRYGLTYHWFIVSRNGNCYATQGPVQTFTLRHRPDLIVTDVAGPAEGASAQEISVYWEIKNDGPGATQQISWLDYVWLSADTILDNAPVDRLLGSFPNVTALLPGESYFNAAQFTLPVGISGEYRIIVRTNRYGSPPHYISLPETNTLNNQKVSAPFNIVLSSYPDLRVTSVITPANVFSGDSIHLTWQVKNWRSDIIPENAFWNDHVYISSSPFFSIATATFLRTFRHNGSLLYDSSYTASGSVKIPNFIFGPHYIFVWTDAGNRIYEVPFEGNNTNSSLLNVFLTPPPDLQVFNFETPVTASSGQYINLSWTVRNVGATAPLTNVNWIDRIYLSADTILNTSQDILLHSLTVNTPLVPGGSYSRTTNVRFPDDIQGTFYLIIKTDATNTVFEYLNENNNTRVGDLPIRIYAPDLTVQNILIPASAASGQEMQVSWRVRNTGSGNVINAARTDRIYLSQDPAFSLGSATLIGQAAYTESVSSGLFVARQLNVTIPNGLSGNYYVYVQTDALSQIYEGGQEENNTVRSLGMVSIQLSPWPDLTVHSIILPDTIRTGSSFQLTFTIKNQGTATAAGTSWNDSVYISSSPVWNPSQVYALSTYLRSQALLPGAIYSVTDVFTISPAYTLNGSLQDNAPVYIFVYTDPDNNLYEHTGENNNIVRSAPVYITSPPPVDLEVISVNAGQTAYSGQRANVSWEVRNNGNATNYAGPPNGSWWDGVYLSRDTVFNSSADVLVTWRGYNQVLGTGQTYSTAQDFIVPNGLSGDYYLFMVTDHRNTIHDPFRDNNHMLFRDASGHPQVFQIIPTPAPDLYVSQFAAPASGTAGQPIMVSWEVTNQGEGQTTGNGWGDGIFLSSDYTIGPGDIRIGTKAAGGNLQPGQSYSRDFEITLPATLSAGTYVILVGANYNNRIYESDLTNNSRYSLIHITVPPPCDLVVSSVQYPAAVTAGDSIFVDYTIRNNGLNPASGRMTDGFYISRDDHWDVSDPLIGTLTYQVLLGPGSEQHQTRKFMIPAVPSGNYKILVKTDLLNNIIETSDSNNTGTGIDYLHIDVTPLPIAVLTPAGLPDETYLYYKISIPDLLSGETLLITLTGNTPGAENGLYLRYEGMPSQEIHDFRHGFVTGANQEILVPVLQSGAYYLAVKGSSSAAENQQITLLARILPFEIRSVASNRGGNTGTATVLLSGSKFEPGMSIRLENGTGNVISGSISHFINSTKLYVTFNLNGQPLGYYTVVAQKPGNQITILPDGFEIVTGSGGGFFVNSTPLPGSTEAPAEPGCDPNAGNGLNSMLLVSVDHPGTARLGQLIPMTIYFGNSGNVDIPVPSRFLFSSGAPLAFDVQHLGEQKRELYLEFREPGGPPHVLRPGATGSIVVYTRGTGGLRFLIAR